MSDNPCFMTWVCSAIHAISGVWPVTYWRAPDDECALTYAENRMAACQGPAGIYLGHEFLEFIRPARLGVTNNGLIH